MQIFKKGERLAFFCPRSSKKLYSLWVHEREIIFHHPKVKFLIRSFFHSAEFLREKMSSGRSYRNDFRLYSEK